MVSCSSRSSYFYYLGYYGDYMHSWEAYIGRIGRNKYLIRVCAALFGMQISILCVEGALTDRIFKDISGRTKHFDNRMVQPLFVLLKILGRPKGSP